MREVIQGGCSKKELENFYEEYMELQRKFTDKGYHFKL